MLGCRVTVLVCVQSLMSFRLRDTTAASVVYTGWRCSSTSAFTGHSCFPRGVVGVCVFNSGWPINAVYVTACIEEQDTSNAVRTVLSSRCTHIWLPFMGLTRSLLHRSTERRGGHGSPGGEMVERVRHENLCDVGNLFQAVPRLSRLYFWF